MVDVLGLNNLFLRDSLKLVEVTLGRNFVRLTFDQSLRSGIKNAIRRTDLERMHMFQRSAWLSFDPEEIENIKRALEKSGFKVRILSEG